MVKITVDGEEEELYYCLTSYGEEVYKTISCLYIFVFSQTRTCPQHEGVEIVAIVVSTDCQVNPLEFVSEDRKETCNSDYLGLHHWKI